MKNVLYGIVTIALLGVLAWVIAPREPVNARLRFQPSDIGEDVEAYLYKSESGIPDLVRGAQKHVIWANPGRKDKTEWSVVYVHGFSATSHEIRPVPALVAEEIGANLFYTRLKGHGRDGAGMMDGNVPDWLDDMVEAVEIGRRIGDRVIVIATSTGATLATKALADKLIGEEVSGLVFVSPNFELADWRSRVLGWPLARKIVPLIAGKEHIAKQQNADHKRHWTLRYPSEAMVPMGALLRAANKVNFSR